MNFSQLNFAQFNSLLATATYTELGLRAKEYLQYLNTDGEEQYLAETTLETTLYNCLVAFLKDLGMEEDQAQKYCDNSANLSQLARYISSILE